MVVLLRVALLAQLAVPRLTSAQPPQNPQPCVTDCLEEALANDPTKDCPAGNTWEPYPRTDPTEQCRPCPAGFYCPGTPYGEFPELMVNLNRKIACPIGTYRAETGASSLTQCEPCPVGTFQDWYGQPSCKNCPAGTYVDVLRSTSVRDCIPCPRGHFCVEGAGEPTPCARGTFTRYPRIREVINCLPCPPGYFCPLGTSDPSPCPAGTYGNKTGIVGLGEHPGTYGMPGVIQGNECDTCPSSFYCPVGSAIPTSCAPGTRSEPGAHSLLDCKDCPVGSRCQLPVDPWTLQSMVVREAYGEQIVGSADPETCEVDFTVVHHSYPSITGCKERCPYQLPRQSYCHIAGDGRPPDRSLHAVAVAELLAKRGRYHGSPAFEEARNATLVELNEMLESLPTDVDRMSAVTMIDRNGRTPLMQAAMLDDAEALEVLWRNGAGGISDKASVARDAEGFTALMRALQLGNMAATRWLVKAGAKLASHDASLLRARGVDIEAIGTMEDDAEGGGISEGGGYGESGLPYYYDDSVEEAPAYLGRGNLAWTHPSLEDFRSELPDETAAG